MSGLTLKNIKKYYDKTAVIPDLSLEIHSGEFLVLVGPSGCGKSTLLRMIAGLDALSDGTIHIEDTDVTDLPAGKRGLSMVFQSYALYPHMTVRQNLAFGLKNIRTPPQEIARRISEAALILRLEDMLDRLPQNLSGGQRQRVAIGRSIVQQPKVFLFDEPLSNLDAALRVQMRQEISQLHARLKNTMIYVTHDQVEAMTLADRIVVLNKGHIEQIGTPVELYNCPASLFVAGFIGTPKINVIPARVEDRQLCIDGQPMFPLGDKYPSVQDGQTVSLAIRPELLRLNEVTDHAFGVLVDFTELQGDSTLVYARVGEHILKMKSSKQLSFAKNTPLRFGFNAASILLFDEAGRRILPDVA
ncbi:ABC transporter ATP-binding protein [Rahnella aquatilis]|uniref:ATPase component of ABC-type sugar transporter n=1 Tax=Rahnella aquatilis (strain ATCC 33071 / DSM 4594 / JCM 1683 / NBRC 105701 / NCIMB 13365 / CIP 78.65) TaxID=745277 RepID=H2IWM5_RAHAC|nr:sn-glycerol-3-phosphate ABC transporter ATP-binding protein UgpC [Rahnella aquatilis]AEX54074.1 ATPase component of ABC-type sugar transporter [Rahnella aquatilis CIP 78.65 = ATCC 33071]KFD00417.1 ABC superfamily transporter [Rahnella aquatilis CIP 78.65 = ATCC 33071]